MALQPRVLASLRVTFGMARAAALIDLVVRRGDRLDADPLRLSGPARLLDAMVDLPFALPTAVAGIALSTLYAPNGWIGARAGDASGSRSPTRRSGILVALVFVGLPFVVRTVEPVIAVLERELEEASATLGASRWRTIWRVVMPGTGAGAV